MNDYSIGTTGQAGPRASAATGLESFGAGAPPHPVADPTVKRFDPREIWRMINKQRRVIVAMAILVPLLVLGLSLLSAPLYQATAQIRIDREDPILIPGSDKPIILNGQEFLATQVGMLKSRQMAARVVDALRLANDPRYAPPGGNAASRRETAANQLRNQVAIDVVRDSRLVNLTVVDGNPAQAAAIANTYSDQFIASNLQRDYDANSYARKFLEERIASTRDKLEKSERDVVAYATQQGIIEVGAGDDKGAGKTSLEATQLVDINAALAQARTARLAAEMRYRQAQGNAATTDMVNNPVLQDLTQKRAEALAEYQEKSLIFLPGLPALVALKERIATFDREIARIRGSVGSASRLEYEGAVARERELQGRLDGLKGSVLDLRKRSIAYTILQREVDTNRALYDALLQKYKEVGVAGGIGSNKVQIVDRAEVPLRPFSPRTFLNVFLGLLAGLLVGFGLAFLIEFIDDTIKMPDDVRSKLHMVLLGIVPQKPDDHEFAAEVADPKSDVVEAAHSLRTSLQFATGHGLPRSLLITSSRPGEGKSSVTLALANSIARLGKRVLIVDADMRKPTFYVGNTSRADTAGLSNLLTGEASPEQATHRSSFENLDIIPAGPSVPNPAALLSEDGFRKLLEAVRARYDHVIVDGPPVMGLADAPIMASMVEATVMIVETGEVHRSTILAAVNRLRASSANVIGVVLNRFESRRATYGYGYEYSYSYGGAGTTSGSDEEERRIAIVK